MQLTMNDLVVGVALGGGEIELTGRDHDGPRVVPLVWANTEQSKRRIFAGQRVFLLGQRADGPHAGSLLRHLGLFRWPDGCLASVGGQDGGLTRNVADVRRRRSRMSRTTGRGPGGAYPTEDAGLSSPGADLPPTPPCHRDRRSRDRRGRGSASPAEPQPSTAAGQACPGGSSRCATGA